MNNVVTVLFLFSSVMVSGCSDGQKQDRHSQETALAEVTAKNDVDNKFGGYVETIGVAKAAGYDYLKVVCDCLLRKEAAIHDLFVMTERAGFDAASSEGHSGVLGYVLRDTGDRFFGELLAHESESVQKAVRDDVLYDLGYGNWSITESEIRDLYPKTFPSSFKFSQ